MTRPNAPVAAHAHANARARAARLAVAVATLGIALASACATRDTDVGVSLEPPLLSLGADAYRDWHRWPVLRIGTRTIMRSTYDRRGGNHAVDASHFIREDQGSFVTLDLAGSGVLAFVRTNHWHGSPWRYTVDGRRTIVSETSTADPDHPVPGSTFLPEHLFPSPVAVTWSSTHGADLSWVPIPFERSFELAYGRTHYGTGYYIAQLVPEGTVDTTSPLATWSESPPPAHVVDVFARAGTDVAPVDGVARRTGMLRLDPGVDRAHVLTLDGHGTLRALRFAVPRAAAHAFGSARLRITWDDRAEPSVDAPVALFFGTGSMHNRDGKEVLVGAFPVNVRFPRDRDVVELATYFPMPFASRARIELSSAEGVDDVAWEARWSEEKPEEPYGLFHATYRDHATPERGRDLVLLDTAGVEGARAWCGHTVGTSIVFSDRAALGTLEGDPRFFFDDSETPQVQGTGTEEWGGGGDYWGGRTMTLPFVGHPVGAPSPDAAKNEHDLVQSLYRFLLADAMPFGRRARLQLEHGGLNDSEEHYRSVAYWYGWPDACLVEADALDVGDAGDEARHAYAASGASEPYRVQSRFEVGVDHVGDVEVVPESTEDGRTVRIASEMTFALPKDNLGVVLRRRLDYRHADQRAEVLVAAVDERGRVAPFERAGTWLTAGSDTSLYSNPKEELGAPEVEVITSDRRLRDDEFLVPRRLTAGQTRVRVRFVVTPHGKPLRTGEPPPDGLFTELRYVAYAWVMPRAWRRR